jgi:hypothetical protein
MGFGFHLKHGETLYFRLIFNYQGLEIFLLVTFSEKDISYRIIISNNF